MKNILILVVSLITVSFLSMNAYSQDDHKSCCSDGDHSSCTESTCTHHSSTINNSNDVDNVTTLVCPVSKKEIGDGSGVKFSYLGKEYTFSCSGCLDKFKSEPMDYIEGDLECPVMGGQVNSEFFIEYNGVKYYFCCEGCISKFNSDPEKYLENSDD